MELLVKIETTLSNKEEKELKTDRKKELKISLNINNDESISGINDTYFVNNFLEKDSNDKSTNIANSKFNVRNNIVN